MRREEGGKTSDTEVTTVMKEGFLPGTSKEQSPLASKELYVGLSPWARVEMRDGPKEGNAAHQRLRLTCDCPSLCTLGG